MKQGEALLPRVDRQVGEAGSQRLLGPGFQTPVPGLGLLPNAWHDSGPVPATLRQTGHTEDRSLSRAERGESFGAAENSEHTQGGLYSMGGSLGPKGTDQKP